MCGVGKSTRGCSLLSNAGFLLPELKVPVLRAPWGHWQSSCGCVTPKGAPGKAPGAASPPPCAHPGERKASELPQLSCEEQDYKIRGVAPAKTGTGGSAAPTGATWDQQPPCHGDRGRCHRPGVAAPRCRGLRVINSSVRQLTSSHSQPLNSPHNSAATAPLFIFCFGRSRAEAPKEDTRIYGRDKGARRL